ncbi:MAG: phenylalanine--tRNA ligase subunit beta [Ruminococcaceae bacterium]|nr:phenylalanine--tRNA ligase subunit beta [Oscillospiraceae bacterium]
MFLSMNWIGDFVDLRGLDKKALIKNFTLSTAEVEDIIVKGEDTFGVVVARILSVENHPKSKKLHLLKVDTGNGVIDVVCGAPNVREGMKVALATEGGSVAGHAIGAAVVAGFESHGMCCSEAELGISDDNSGIMEIFEDAPLGTDIKSLYDIDDIIFEVDNKSLTNRPDLWGHYGIAREFATIISRPLKAPETISVDEYSALPPVSVMIKDPELCYRYTAMKVDNVTLAKSPVNMRIRLYYCGSRAINFLADLTNYVMLELGQPMHAFDNRLVDKIEVQTFDKEFKFVTLDGTERNIDTNMLMITSGDEPVAIAGVMGGDASKISDSTTSLLLESATFNGVSVRKTTTKLGLRTDASMRYEKMLDPELCRLATERVLSLIMKNDSGARVISSFTDSYPYHYPTIELDFDKSYVDRYTGIDIPKETIVKTLTGLGFGINTEGDSFKVTVPSWRSTKDVTIKADIIEEISRIYGYDNFDVCTSVSALAPIREEALKSNEDRMKDILVSSYRMHEVHSYIWSDSKKNRELMIDTPENVRIINAQTPDHQYIRVSMIPTLLSFIKENRGYNDSYGLFEIGHTVEGIDENGRCNEQKKLGAVLYSKTECEEKLFCRLTDMAKELCRNILHKAPTFRSVAPVYGFEHPANCFEISVEGKKIGFISVPHPTVLAAIDKKCAVAFLELCTEIFSDITPLPTSYKVPSRFPEIDIDLTFSTNLSEVVFDELAGAATAAADGLLSDISVKDIYTEEDGSCALTVRFSFVSSDRTLTKQELAPVTQSIEEALKPLGLTVKL